MDADKLFIVTAKPQRPGGSSNFRWLPSANGALICRVYEGDELTVIAEGKDWYQCMNAEGYVGFIAKNYTSVVYFGDIPEEAAENAAAAQ